MGRHPWSAALAVTGRPQRSEFRRYTAGSRRMSILLRNFRKSLGLTSGASAVLQRLGFVSRLAVITSSGTFGRRALIWDRACGLFISLRHFARKTIRPRLIAAVTNECSSLHLWGFRMRQSCNEDHLNSTLWTKCRHRWVFGHGVIPNANRIYRLTGLTIS